MPIYGYRCPNEECKELSEDEASMSSFKEHHPLCPVCATPCNYEWIPSVPHAVLKDGPSGSWPSKGERIKKQMQQRSENAARRQRDHVGEGKKLIPNYEGKETGTWQEAQHLAEKERGIPSAASYDKLVTKEKSGDTSITVPVKST